MKLLPKKKICFAWLGFCACFFMVFVFLKSQNIAFDFYVFYTAGKIFNNGQNVYNPELFINTFYNIAGAQRFPELWVQNAYFYPPQGTALFSLLAHFPIEVSHKIVLYLNSFLLFFYLYLLSVTLSCYKSLKLIDFCLISSLIITGFANENIKNSQFGILISILLILTYLLAKINKNLLAGLTLAVTSIKPSFLPFFIIYFIIRRQYSSVIYCFLFSIIFTVSPLILTGRPIISTLTEWLTVISTLDEGITNSPEPLGKFSFHYNMIHLEPLIYRLFNGQIPVSMFCLKAILGMIILYCCWLFIKKDRENKAELLDFGLVSTIAMLFVYHRIYDIFLLFPALLYIYLYILECENSREKRLWIYILSLIFLLISFLNIFFIKMSYWFRFLEYSYLWKLFLPLPWSGVITLSALLWLKTKNRLAKLSRESSI